MYRTLTLLIISTTLMTIAAAERLDPVDESRPHILNVYIEGHDATCFGQGIDTKQIETSGLKHVPEVQTKGEFTVTVEFDTGPRPPERLAVELYFPSWLVVPPKYELKPEKGVEIDHPEPNSTIRADLRVRVGEGPNPLSIGDEYYLVAVLRDPTKESDVLDYVVFKLRFKEPRGGESTHEPALLKVTRSALGDAASVLVAGFILGSLSVLVAEIVCGWIHSGPAAQWATVIGGLIGALLVSI
ncbi:hypothetical protein [Methanopyrus sp. SNP6]|uniref:hypothetical protein n=1 Tax=Methanopyrus sp. SNP6 TaxID=1937005 RepID=UPI0011E5C9C6|nr:hypothetical protein [Methanopyrus sp. SNP6]